MARLTESSFITTLAGLEQMERERAEAERREREAELEEQRRRERRLAAEAEAAERRARWAEQDRVRAEARERDQHEARLKAMHEALVQTARIEAESRHERERVQEVHAHERKLAEITNDARVHTLRRRFLTAGVGLLVLGGVAATFAYDSRAKAGRIEETRARIDTLERSLAHAEGERDHARERQSLGEARIALLETKLTTMLAAKAPAPEPASARPAAPPRPNPPREREPKTRPCQPGLDGDPLNDCVP